MDSLCRRLLDQVQTSNPPLAQPEICHDQLWKVLPRVNLKHDYNHVTLYVLQHWRRKESTSVNWNGTTNKRCSCTKWKLIYPHWSTIRQKVHNSLTHRGQKQSPCHSVSSCRVRRSNTRNQNLYFYESIISVECGKFFSFWPNHKREGAKGRTSTLNIFECGDEDLLLWSWAYKRILPTRFESICKAARLPTPN